MTVPHKLSFVFARGPSPQRVQEALRVGHKQHFELIASLAVTPMK